MKIQVITAEVGKLKTLPRRFYEKEHTVGCSLQLVKVAGKRKRKVVDQKGSARFSAGQQKSHAREILFTCQLGGTREDPYDEEEQSSCGGKFSDLLRWT